jgi:hypothetical protein
MLLYAPYHAMTLMSDPQQLCLRILYSHPISDDPPPDFACGADCNWQIDGDGWGQTGLSQNGLGTGTE